MHETPEHFNNNKHFDMATATKVIKPFKGAPGEDAAAWLSTYKMLTEALDIPEAYLTKVLVCCFEDIALQWAAEIRANNPDISIEDFLKLFEIRFSGRLFNENSLNKLCSSKEAQSRDSLSSILRVASSLEKAKYISSEALKDIISRKIPSHLTPSVRHAATSTKGWQEFLKYIEDNVMPILPEFESQPQVPYEGNTAQLQEIMAVSKSSRDTRRHQFNNNLKSKDFQAKCPLHGGHLISECRVIKQRMLQAGMAILPKKDIKSTNTIFNGETLDYNVAIPDKGNKTSYDYSIFETNVFSSTRSIDCNPFYTEGLVEGLPTRILIDTGADVSILNYYSIPPSARRKILHSSEKIRSASGSYLDIFGTIRKVALEINNTSYILEKCLVVKNHPKFMIIGVDNIIINPEIILSNKFIRTRLLNSEQLHRSRDKTIAPHSLNSQNPITANTCELTQSPLNHTENLKKTLLTQFKSIFKDNITQNTLCTFASHKIPTERTTPIAIRNQRIPIAYEKAIDEEVRRNLDSNIISHSTSPWCSRLVPADKKDGTLRLCVDFRALNNVTIKDKYPIPRIDELIDKLGQAKYFSTLDATSGFHQLAIDAADKCKTAFSWRNGHYEFNRMPFGLCNAPATFQRAMDKLFEKERDKFVLPYFDDIIVYSDTEESHLKHLETVFSKIKGANMVLNPKKCKLLQSEIEILGFIVGAGYVKPDPKKVLAIKNFAKPQTISQLRSFLGLINYSREFIPRFASLTEPLYTKLKGETKKSQKPITWSDREEKAFLDSKKALNSSTSRAQPDFRKRFIVITDASDLAIGGLLIQVSENGREQIVHTFSKLLD